MEGPPDGCGASFDRSHELGSWPELNTSFCTVDPALVDGEYNTREGHSSDETIENRLHYYVYDQRTEGTTNFRRSTLKRLRGLIIWCVWGISAGTKDDSERRKDDCGHCVGEIPQ